MTLLDVLQQINKTSMDAAGLTDMTVGTVTSVSPLEVTLDVAQAPIKEELLILTDTVRGTDVEDYFREADGELCIVWDQDTQRVKTLKLNDKVLLLAVQHGQKFIILSRL